MSQVVVAGVVVVVFVSVSVEFFMQQYVNKAPTLPCYVLAICFSMCSQSLSESMGLQVGGLLNGNL